MSADEATHAWLDDVFAAIDARDSARFVGFLTDDATFRFGSAPAVHGREGVREAVDGFFSTIAGCKHRLANILIEDGTLVCEGEVTYTRHDGTEIDLPFANVFELDGEYISQYKIYADAGPLYAE